MKSVISTTAAQNLLGAAALRSRFTAEQIVDRIVSLKTKTTESAEAEADKLVADDSPATK